MREADRLLQEGSAVRLSNLVGFLSAEVRVKRNSLFSPRSAEPGRREAVSRSSPGFKVSAARVTRPSAGSERCPFCDGRHELDRCQRMFERPWPERRRTVLRAGLCFGCLREGHRARSCRSQLTCRSCGGRHPSVMHRDPDCDARGFPAAPPVSTQPPVARRVPAAGNCGPRQRWCRRAEIVWRPLVVDLWRHLPAVRGRVPTAEP